MTENLNTEIKSAAEIANEKIAVDNTNYQLDGKKADEKEIKIPLTGETAFKLKLSEFDKEIAILKAKTAEMEAQKMAFIHEININIIKQDFERKKKELEQLDSIQK